MVKVDVPVGVTDDGLKLALAPDGRPDADRETVWAVPPVSVAVMVYVVDPPWVILLLPGEADRLKSKATGATDMVTSLPILFPDPSVNQMLPDESPVNP